MYSVGTNGILPLSWNDIDCWLRVLERDLTLFEKTCIREMSVAYCNEYAAASEKTARPPYSEVVEMTPEKQKQINDELKRSLEAMMAHNKEKAQNDS